MLPPIPSDEAERLAVLRGLGILDTPPDPALDELTRLAADVLGTPIALVSLVDEDRQWFKSRVGLAATQTPRCDAFCAHAIAQEGLFVVADAWADPRFASNPLVRGDPFIRFYAGVPMRVEGRSVGTLCVIDRQARTLSDRERSALERIAGLVAAQLLRHRDAATVGLARARLADFLVSSGDWLWETAGLRVTWVSDNITRVLGVTPAAYQGHLVIEGLLDDTEVRERNASALAAIRAHGPFRDLYVRRAAADGPRVVVKSGVPVLDAGGRFVGYRGVSRDVTAAHASSRMAALADRRLAEAIEAIEEPFVMTDPAGGIVLTNARWRELNRTEGVQLPQTWRDLVLQHLEIGLIETARGREAEWLAERTTLRGQRPGPIEVRRGGRDFLLRDVVLSDGSCVTAGQDVTAIRAEHRAALDSARRLTLALSAAGLTIWEADLDSGSVCSVGEMQPGEPGRVAPGGLDAWLLRVADADRERLRDGLRAVWDGRLDVLHDEFSVLIAGTTHRIALAVAQEAATLDRPRRLVAVRRDVTEIRRAEEAARLKTAADLANRAKSEFLSRVGHELRTPLNAIRGLAQVMQREAGQSVSSRQSMIGHVVTASEHLAALLDDLLDMSQVETGRLTIRREPVPVAATVRDCLRMIAPQAAGHGIALECGRIPEGLRVMADQTRLRQILLNLASNAVKYNRPQGRVRLDAEDDPGDGFAQIAVVDTGLGLTRDEISRVFRPFERLSRPGADQTEGLGLGLSIAQGLAQAMGGSIVVDSDPGRGTRFVVHLPAAPVLAAEGAARLPVAEPPTAPPDAPPRRVMYVEDNRLNGLLMTQIARQVVGVDMQVVESGEEALETIGAFDPDLLLLDHDLPGIDGLEVQRRLKQDPRWAGLRIVLVSADANAESIARARALGFDDYWVKPLDVARVIDALGGSPGVLREDQPAGA
ncbi:MAG: ATP-binding protein [Burkholderiales bacterium]|nr:ATP-binding protein [Burkholderiales bacterium]